MAAQWPSRNGRRAILGAAAGLLLAAALLTQLRSDGSAQPQMQYFITSVDTMKESKDTARAPLTDAQIRATIRGADALHADYVAVATDWDYTTEYLRRWVAAARGEGKRVWFRVHPAQWENDYGVTGVMSPPDYLAALDAFIAANPNLFRPGDIFDPCPEPENGKYWQARYGRGWDSATARTPATDEYNRFILDTSAVADAALARAGVSGVTTTIRSTNGRIAFTPTVLYPETTARLGTVTIDSFPGPASSDPAAVAGALLDEIARVRAVHGLPVVLGEFGYNAWQAVDETTQRAVLRAMLDGLATVPYLRGANYWVISGDPGVGSRLYDTAVPARGRAAAGELAAFYRTKQAPPPARGTGSRSR
ncbi:MAG: hypothetical protein U0232_31550 [Thermomicrobiales bacterium]